MTTVLTARQLLTPLERIENAALTIKDGIIAGVCKRGDLTVPTGARVFDFGDAILAPGLIDIHVHGGAAHDVMDASDDGLAAIERLMFRHGVTSYCPTTVTAPIDRTLQSLEALGRAVQQRNTTADRARPLGIHLEGPFLSHARRGVHSPLYLQRASQHIFDQMWEAAGGQVSMLTIAPELAGALELIRNATARGICVSIGHSNATLEQAVEGVRAGARHATHTFNAMRRLDHRDPGLLGAILTANTLTADIIADGQHVRPEVVDVFVRAKGLDRAVLITDAISATGMPDGTYHLGSYQVEVSEGRCESHGKLAGSVLTMDRAIHNVMTFCGVRFQDAIRLATLNPARVLGIENRKGVLQVGADADIAVFSAAGEVRQTIVGGALV